MGRLNTSVNKALNIETGESLQVQLLIAQSLFLGMFYMSYEIAATALFLNSYSSEMLPKAFLISGLVGFALTALYSRLQSKINFSVLISVNLFVIFLITIALRLLFDYTHQKELIFLIFVFMGPLNLLGLIGFWGMAGRLFTLRQGKRLFGMIDSGQIIGMIIISYAVPSFLLQLIHNKTEDLIYLSGACALAAMIIQFVIIFKFFKRDSESERLRKIEKEEKSETFVHLLRKRYIFLMSLFVMLSMLIAFFIYYSFMAATAVKYPEPKDLAKFLGVFIGTIMVFSLIFKTFIYSRLIDNYGLKVSLLIHPILLLLFTLVIVAIGNFMTFDYNSGSFTLFFLLVALSRLFNVSLKSSVEMPSFKLLYQSLDRKYRYKVQASIDGVINELSALLAGVVLLVLSYVKGFELIHYSYILGFIIIVFIFTTVRVYRHYRKALEQTLAQSKIAYSGAPSEKIKSIPVSAVLKNMPDDKIPVSAEFLWKTEPITAENIFIELLKSNNNQKKLHTLHIIQSKDIYQATQDIVALINDPNPEISKSAKSIFNRFSEDLELLKNPVLIDELVNSNNEAERELATKIIGHTENEKYIQLLQILIRDIIPSVKYASLKAVSKFKRSELCPMLIDYLTSEKYYKIAAASLRKMENIALEPLEHAFYKTGLDTAVQVRIIKLIGYIQNEIAINYLFNKLKFTNRDIVVETVKTLKKCNFKPNEIEKRQFIELIKTIANVLSWNINALYWAKEYAMPEELCQSLQEEVKGNYNFLYLLLSIIYDEQTIQHIRKNIETEINESVSFALELMELFVDEELKNILFPLLDDSPAIEKIRKMQDFFPLQKYTEQTLLHAIINKDYNHVSRWTKLCAIQACESETIGISNDLIAHLFNSDYLLKETTAAILSKKDSDMFGKSILRLDKIMRNAIETKINKYSENTYILQVEKVNFLKELSYFKPFHSVFHCNLSDSLEYIEIPAETIITQTHLEQNFDLYFLIDGQLTLEESNGKLLALLSNNAVFGNFSVSSAQSNRIVKTQGACKLFKLPEENVINLAFDSTKFTDFIFKLIEKDFIESAPIA